MKASITTSLAIVLVATSGVSASATDPFRAAWKRYYVDSQDSVVGIKTTRSVKCSVCHLEHERKDQLSEYGSNLLKNGLSIANFPADRFAREPEAVQKEIEEIFKKTEGSKR